MKRSALIRRTRLKPFSAKRRREIPARRACREQVYERDGGRCRVRGPNCQGEGMQVHEIRSRARGGSITAPENCICVCAACHRQIHDNPAWATARGLLKRGVE